MKEIEHDDLPITVEKTNIVESFAISVFVECPVRVELVHMVEIIFFADFAGDDMYLQEDPGELEKDHIFDLAVYVNGMYIFEALVEAEFISISIFSVIMFFEFEDDSKFAGKSSLEVCKVAYKGVEIVEMLVFVSVVEIDMVFLDGHFEEVEDVLIWKETFD